MKALRSLIPCILLLLAAPSLQAQWSGSLDLAGGYGWLSADHKEAWTESVRANRRLVVLGLNWNFL